MLAETQSHRNSFIAHEHEKWKGHFGRPFHSSLLSWTRLTIGFSDQIPKCLPSQCGNFGAYKNVHANVYSSFIHNHPRLEATKMSSNGWTERQTRVPASVQYDSEIKMNAIKPHKDMNAYCWVEDPKSEKDGSNDTIFWGKKKKHMKTLNNGVHPVLRKISHSGGCGVPG